MYEYNSLVFSHLIEGNKVFEDYCNGIKRLSKNYYYFDYVREYLNRGKRGFEAAIESIISDKNITHIFFIWWSSDLTFSPDFIERLSRKAKLIINYYDTEYFFEGVDRYYAQYADLVMLPDCLSRYKYQQLNINAISTFALYDPMNYQKKSGTVKDIDVSFVGNLKQSNRKEYIKYLEDNGISVDTYGVDSKHGFATFDQMVDVFNRSKINLNFTTTSDRSGYVINPPQVTQRIRQSKGRPNEIALCGGFILSQYAPGIEEMYELGEEIDTFKTKEELLEKVKHYLASDLDRTDMEQRSHNRAMANYTAEKGFIKVFDRIKEIGDSAEKSNYLDNIFLENYIAFRFFFIIQFALTGRLYFLLEELIIIFKHRAISPKKSYYFAIKGMMTYLRDRPNIERIFKSIKSKLNIKVKY